MDIKSFNEIWKELEGAGSQGSDGEIATLAKKLHAQGIASTMLEAREKAQDMLRTDKEIVKSFDAKKEELTRYNDPRNNPNYRYREQKILEMRQRAMRGGRAPVAQTIPDREPRRAVVEEHVTQVVDIPPPVTRPHVQTIIEEREEKNDADEQGARKPRRENPSVDLGSVFNYGGK